MTPWILGSSFKDIAVILTPGLFAFLFFYTIPSIKNLPGIISALAIFIVLYLVDVGHVYTTLWRTLFNKDERSTHSLYIFSPLVCFIIVFLWHIFQLPYLWGCIVYLSFFHHIRQYYGIIKWYEKKTQDFSNYAGYMLYLLCVIPIISMHF